MSASQFSLKIRLSVLLSLILINTGVYAELSLRPTADPLVWQGEFGQDHLAINYRQERFDISVLAPKNTTPESINQKYFELLSPLFQTEHHNNKLPTLPFVNQRWSPAQQSQVINSLIYGAQRTSHNIGQQVQFNAIISWPLQSLKMRLTKWLPMILRHSKDWNIEPALTLAVIHQESAFKAYARSGAPAYGLMQITPDMAGRDVARLLSNTNKKIPEYLLFDPEFNLMVGIAYLHYLDTKYFSNVTNKKSRMLCSIAAYNGGMGHVKKLFSAKYSEFNNAVNKLSPGEVQSILATKHPFKETRDYVRKVYKHYEFYHKTLNALSK